MRRPDATEPIVLDLCNSLLIVLSFIVCDQCNQGGSGACSLMTREPGRPAELKCCHEECAGGCSGNQSNQCDVCKHVIHQKECRSVCPPGHYLVSCWEKECLNGDGPGPRSPFPRNFLSWPRSSLAASPAVPSQFESN